MREGEYVERYGPRERVEDGMGHELAGREGRMGVGGKRGEGTGKETGEVWMSIGDTEGSCGGNEDGLGGGGLNKASCKV